MRLLKGILMSTATPIRTGILMDIPTKATATFTPR